MTPEFKLLDELNTLARNVCPYSYGLPLVLEVDGAPLNAAVERYRRAVVADAVKVVRDLETTRVTAMLRAYATPEAVAAKDAAVAFLERADAGGHADELAMLGAG